MNRSVKNFILTALLGSALLVAGLSSDARGNSYGENFSEVSTRNQTVTFSESKGGKSDSEFWSKFRDSVMPNEKNPSAQSSRDPKPPMPPKNN